MTKRERKYHLEKKDRKQQSGFYGIIPMPRQYRKFNKPIDFSYDPVYIFDLKK